MRRLRGYSLIELLIVVGLLALIAAVAAPSYLRGDELELDRAAAEVADAIRFARSLAMRRGEAYGVSASSFSDRIDVYRLDESGSFPVPVYDVRNPLSKQLYRIEYDANGNDPDVTAVYFDYQGSSIPRANVGFSARTGVPKYSSFGSIQLLESGYITLSKGSLTRSVIVSPMTGRVTIQ